MSRAFVKEAEDKVEDLPDRPISGHRNLVTPEGLAAIEAALTRFENAHREAITRNDAHATAAAMREIRYWRARRASAEVGRRPPTILPDRGRGRSRSVAQDGLIRFASRPGRHDVAARRHGGDSRRQSRDTGRPVGSVFAGANEDKTRRMFTLRRIPKAAQKEARSRIAWSRITPTTRFLDTERSHRLGA
jgi:hypothetical protein